MTAKLSRERWWPDRPVTGDSLTHPTEVEKTAHNTVRLPQGPGKRVVYEKRQYSRMLNCLCRFFNLVISHKCFFNKILIDIKSHWLCPTLKSTGCTQQNVADGKCPKCFTLLSTSVSETLFSSQRSKHVVWSQSSLLSLVRGMVLH